MHSYFYHAKVSQYCGDTMVVSVSGIIHTESKILTMQDYYHAKELVSKQDGAKQIFYEVVLTTLTYLGESNAN